MEYFFFMHEQEFICNPKKFNCIPPSVEMTQGMIWFLLIRVITFFWQYSFVDFLSNMVMPDYIKNQSTKVLFDGPVTKSNKSFNILVYFFSKEIFAQLFSFEYSFADFPTNLVSRISAQALFREFFSCQVN